MHCPGLSKRSQAARHRFARRCELPEDCRARYRSQISPCPRFAHWLAHGPLIEAARIIFHNAGYHVRVAEVEYFGKSPGGQAGDSTHRGWHTDWPHDPGSGAAVGAVSHPQPDLCMSLGCIFYMTDVNPARAGTWTVPRSYANRRNPRGPSHGMDDAAPMPGEQQITAAAGSCLRARQPQLALRAAQRVRRRTNLSHRSCGTCRPGCRSSLGSGTLWVTLGPTQHGCRVPAGRRCLLRYGISCVTVRKASMTCCSQGCASACSAVQRTAWRIDWLRRSPCRWREALC